MLLDDGRPVGLKWSYTPGELRADAAVHVLGVAFGVCGGIALIVFSTLTDIDWFKRSAIVIYALGLAAMLGVSAAYNMWPVGRRKWLLRRIDHSVIYVMIAATYTPLVSLVGTGPLPWALLAGIWLITGLGVALKLCCPGRYDRLSIGLYLALGWSGVIAYEPVIAMLSPAAWWLLAVGGLLYSFGVIFHIWTRLPFQNAIWHAFVLTAAGCHYGAVLASVLDAAA